MQRQLRSGYTTGACAAAGLQAALIYWRSNGKNKPKFTDITALDGTPLHIPVQDVGAVDNGDEVQAQIVKYSGDDPDITNGITVVTKIKLLPPGSGIIFTAGEGVGRITKPGLSLSPGEAAINPGPRQLMTNVAKKILGENPAVQITISLPGGAELAKRTLNPLLGIEGGLSVIGTTGVLRPMSEEAFKNSLVPQIDVAKAAGYDVQIFVPGQIGARIAAEYGLPTAATVQISNFVGFMLEQAQQKHLRGVMLFGHLGKLAKVSAGVFHTHNRIGDARMETIAAYAAAAGLAAPQVRQILCAATTEEALNILERENLTAQVCHALATRAGERATRYVFGELNIGVCMVTLQGKILGMDEMAQRMGESFGWKLSKNPTNLM